MSEVSIDSSGRWVHSFQNILIRSLEGLSRIFLEIPFPIRTFVENSIFNDSITVTLQFEEDVSDRSSGRGNNKELHLSLSHYHYGLTLRSVEENLDGIIDHCYSHILQEKDQRLIREQHRRIYCEHLIPDNRMMDVEFDFRHILALVDSYHSDSPRHLRYLTIREVEEECRFYDIGSFAVPRYVNEPEYLNCSIRRGIYPLRKTEDQIIAREEALKNEIYQFLSCQRGHFIFTDRIEKLFRIEREKRRRSETRELRSYRYDIETANAIKQRKEANARGERLLTEHLTVEQLNQYRKNQSFIVTGNKTGNKYKIVYGRQMNVYLLNDKEEAVLGYCFVPTGNLCPGDVMLSQKISLELDEENALRVANKFGV